MLTFRLLSQHSVWMHRPQTAAGMVLSSLDFLLLQRVDQPVRPSLKTRHVTGGLHHRHRRPSVQTWFWQTALQNQNKMESHGCSLPSIWESTRTSYSYDFVFGALFFFSVYCFYSGKRLSLILWDLRTNAGICRTRSSPCIGLCSCTSVGDRDAIYVCLYLFSFNQFIFIIYFTLELDPIREYQCSPVLYFLVDTIPMFSSQPVHRKNSVFRIEKLSYNYQFVFFLPYAGKKQKT